MSGGSMDYAYRHVLDAIDMVRGNTPERIAFRTHLARVAAAMRAIEWVDSCDYGKGDEVKAIKSALGTDGPALILSESRQQAEAALDQLKEALADCPNNQGQTRYSHKKQSS